MIALTTAKPRSSYKYYISGSLARNAAWSQVLDLPPISGTTQTITGNTDVAFIFRENKDDTGSILTISVSGSEITVTDADTLTISVSNMASLIADRYYVDLISTLASVTTLWASGVVNIDNSLAS
jgi:hypothetical protein